MLTGLAALRSVTPAPLAAFVLAICALAPTLHAQTRQWDTLPADMRRAMEHTAANINPISMTLVTTSRSGPSTADPAANRAPSSGVQMRIIWQDRNFYLDQIDHRSGNRYEASFNGFAWYSGASGEYTARSRPPPPPRTYWAFGREYLPAIGISVTGSAYQPVTQPRILNLLQTTAVLKGIHSTNIGGRALPVIALLMPNQTRSKAHEANLDEVESHLRSSPLNTEEFIQRTLERIRLERQLPETTELQFTLDPEYGYAVRRIDERYPDGTLLKRTETGEFEYMAERDVWLPRRVRIDAYTSPEAPAEVFDHVVRESTLEIVGGFGLGRVPDDTFTVIYTEPGVRVHDDLSSNRQIQFIIDPGLEDQVRAFLAADPSGLPPGSIPVPTANPHVPWPTGDPEPERNPAAAATPLAAATAPPAIDPPPRTLSWTTIVLILIAASALVLVVILRRIL